MVVEEVEPESPSSEVKSLILTSESGKILYHWARTLVMFDRSETTLVGMNFFDLMISHDRNFFKNNALWTHYVSDHDGESMAVNSDPCKSRIIRYSTPHSEYVNLETINVLTSKLVSINYGVI